VGRDLKDGFGGILGEKLKEKLQDSKDSGTSAHAWKD